MTWRTGDQVCGRAVVVLGLTSGSWGLCLPAAGEQWHLSDLAAPTPFGWRALHLVLQALLRRRTSC